MLEDALASCELALEVKPNYPESLFNRGIILGELKRYEKALTSYDLALKLRPNYAEALSNRGNVLHELKRYGEALTSYDRALAVQPQFADALSNRGNTLHALQRYEDALASYDRALIVRPNFVKALSNRGWPLHEMKRFDEAQVSYDRALALQPDFAEAHWNEALLRLITGDFDCGWTKFEWRWKKEPLVLSKREFRQPLWLGDEAIDGKTILLYSEQGYGDTIQFSRYVPFVAARGARVIFEVEEPLLALMATIIGASQVICKGQALPEFDFHCPLLSLPCAFKTRPETIPAQTPYLSAPIVASTSWQVRLEARSRPKIGLVWSGNPMHKNDQNRSISLQSFPATFWILMPRL